LQNSSRRIRDRGGLAAFAIYLAFATLYFGRALAHDPAASAIGLTADPSVYMWFLVWWPHAIAAHLNPFITDRLWAPGGFNLTWTTGIPLAGVLAAPLTAHYGPVVVYNLLCLLSPALAGWTAFLLCRRLCGRWWPALAGGYVFGFSAYMLAEIRAHLLLILIFPVPLAIHLVLRRLDGELRAASFAALMALTLAASFMLSLEMFATMTFFGAIALAIASATGGADARRRIVALAAPLAASYAVVLAIVSPYLYYFFQPGYPHSPINSPAAYSADLLNLIIPTPANAIGGLAILAAISRRFPGAMVETGACLSIPLIVIAIALARARWHEPRTRILIYFAAVAMLAALGPRLHLAGATLFGMPWKLIQHLPLINNALPARFPMYADLALAIVAALWFASDGPGALAKTVAAAAIVICFAPNPSAAFWARPIDNPAFFADGGFRGYLAPDATVVILPYGAGGPSMLWQAESGMYFRMAGGWTSIMPREFQSWPAVNALFYQTTIPDFGDQLKAFLAHHAVTAIIVDDRVRPLWEPLLAELRGAPIATGGVALYRFTPADLAPWSGLTALAMERRADAARFDAMVAATQTYLAAGGDPARLTPMRLQTLGLIPPESVNEAAMRTANGLFLGLLGDGRIGVGVVGSYAALEPLIARYRDRAARIYFPWPRELAGPPHGDTFMRQLVIAFDRNTLAHAVPAPAGRAADVAPITPPR